MGRQVFIREDREEGGGGGGGGTRWNLLKKNLFLDKICY